MSWLSKIVHNVVKVADPVGDAIRDKVTPAYKAYNSGASAASTTAPAAATTTADASTSSQGDSTSSDYGSYTKPFSVQDFYANLDPGYQFRLQQGQQASVNSAAAGSGSLSGSAMKDLMDYNQNAASSEYNNAFNRYQTSQGNIFNRLYEIAGLGQSSASNVGATGTTNAANTSTALQNAATVSANGTTNATNAVTNAANTYAGYKYLNSHNVA